MNMIAIPHLKAFLEAITDGVIAFDANGCILALNATASSLFGYTPEELQGQNFKILMPEPYSGEYESCLRNYPMAEFKKLVGINRVVAGKRQDGSTFPMDLTVNEMAADGEYLFTGIVRDIAQRKKTEAMQAHFSAIVASSTDAIIGKNLNGIVTSWNLAAARMFGYSESEMLGQSIDLLIPPDHAGEEQAILAGVHQGESIEHFETTRRRKNGEVFPVSVTISPIKNAAGGIVGASKIVRDITERKKAEIESRENRFRALFDTIIDGIVVIDAKGRIQALNPAAVHLFDYTLHEVQGQNVKILMPEPYADEHDGYLHNYLTTGVKKVIGIGREVTGKRKDGSTFPMELAVSEMQVGNERMFTGIVRDITQRKAFETALNMASELAVKANQAKSEFLASMSHELRTPLNAILGFSQLFEIESDLPEEYRNYAGEITRAGKHLLALINDLIDLSRIETGKLDISVESVKVLDVIIPSLQLIDPLAKEQRIALINEITPSDDWSVQADFVRLSQVIINLLSNAIKYNHPAGTVTLSCQRQDGWIRIGIADTGPGIPADKQSRVFTSFDRLGRETSTTVGTGIGLVITRRIVEAMGGSIGFESVEGKGSTFWIKLPQGESAASVLSGNALQNSKNEPAVPGTRHVVLYIEDNPVNVRLLQKIFHNRKNIDLQTAQTAELGLERIRTEPPALIFMDINLPGMNGYEALDILKADPKTAHIPVIALSANAMKGDMEHGKNAGFNNYLTKPINVMELLEIVGDILP